MDLRAMSSLADRAFGVFQPDATGSPSMTLRGGDAVDSYSEPPPYDPRLDQLTDEYIERHHLGVAHLGPASWRIPYPIAYALRNASDGRSMAIDSLLTSLRPPDREPPRLASLSRAQEEVIVSFLDVLAFDEGSAWQDVQCRCWKNTGSQMPCIVESKERVANELRRTTRNSATNRAQPRTFVCRSEYRPQLAKCLFR